MGGVDLLVIRFNKAVNNAFSRSNVPPLHPFPSRFSPFCIGVPVSPFVQSELHARTHIHHIGVEEHQWGSSLSIRSK
jgi:hypothetical protein